MLEYKPREFCHKARMFVLFGMSPEDIASIFEATVEELVALARSNDEFYEALTPSPETAMAFYQDLAAKKRKNRTVARDYSRVRYQNASASARTLNRTRARIHAALTKRCSVFPQLGYSLAELKVHLESLFRPGMSWENYGAWHIDHVRPCCMFDFSIPEQFAEGWALDNLQPLWKRENLSKGNKETGLFPW